MSFPAATSEEKKAEENLRPLWRAGLWKRERRIVRNKERKKEGKKERKKEGK